MKMHFWAMQGEEYLINNLQDILFDVLHAAYVNLSTAGQVLYFYLQGA